MVAGGELTGAGGGAAIVTELESTVCKKISQSFGCRLAPLPEAQQFGDEYSGAAHGYLHHPHSSEPSICIAHLIKVESEPLVGAIADNFHTIKRQLLAFRPLGHPRGLHFDAGCASL